MFETISKNCYLMLFKGMKQMDSFPWKRITIKDSVRVVNIVLTPSNSHRGNGNEWLHKTNLAQDLSHRLIYLFNLKATDYNPNRIFSSRFYTSRVDLEWPLASALGGFGWWRGGGGGGNSCLFCRISPQNTQHQESFGRPIHDAKKVVVVFPNVSSR